MTDAIRLVRVSLTRRRPPEPQKLDGCPVLSRWCATHRRTQGLTALEKSGDFDFWEVLEGGAAAAGVAE